MQKQLQAESNSPKTNTLKDVAADEFERRLLAEVVPPTDVGVKFQDIGALEHVKKQLKEIVMLPLQRPELFMRGSLTKPVKGVLLFGPPGTGKTMLAKAVASESGANFINVQVSSIASKWFGEGEKYVKALFSLAYKIAPSVIFIDEVDALLGRRDKSGEHEAMRKMKNEFMANWDGLKSKERVRVLVLAATNRPMDLDDAVIRRLPRRLMVDLPDAENRCKILKVLLKDEELEADFDFAAAAAMTDGYSGSDLKNLAVAAAYLPILDVLKKEEKEKKAAEGEVEGEAVEEFKLPVEWKGWGEEIAPEQPPVNLRPLGMADLREAMKQVGASYGQDSHSMNDLRQWNELYGEGGSRKVNKLSYFT